MISHDVLLVAVVALVTACLRFLPFVLFGNRKEAPQSVQNLAGVMPYAIMGVLVVYCLRTVSFGSAASWAPQLISAAVVVAVHCYKRNALLSILAGTVCNMVLLQVVFRA